jgi:hypothetical protein
VSNTGDEPRLLARRAELGYVSHPQGALPGEPEAISAEEQRRQTLMARRRAAVELRRAWESVRCEVVAAITSFKVSARTDRQVLDGLRTVERALDRISRHLDELSRPGGLR